MRDCMSFDAFRIRAFREDDTQGVFDAVEASIPELARYETWCHPGYTEAEAEEYVSWWIRARAEKRAFFYAVEETGSGCIVGACGLCGYSVEHRHAELGYWTHAAYTGRGIATAAARAVARAGFEDLDLVRISLGISVGNAASLRIAEKLGAVREGILRNGLILPEGVTDLISYSLIPGELEGG